MDIVNIAHRHDYRGASSKVDAELYKQVYQYWVTEATQVRQSTGANITFVLQHISQNLVQKGNERGGNPLGLANIPQQCKMSLGGNESRSLSSLSFH
jgi:hypothetical protein